MRKRKSHIIAVGGGKGGVGKTLTAAGLAASLAEMGLSVILIDVDLGGSNVHTLLEVEPEDDSATITRYFRVKGSLLDEILLSTDFRGLKVACGSLHNYRLVNLPYFSKLRFFNELRRKEVDCVVLDLGSGSAYTTLDFFAFSDTGILVTTVEKTAIENLYRFLRGAFLRKLRFELEKYGREIVDTVMNNPDLKQLPNPQEVISTIEHFYPQYGDRIRDFLKTVKVGIVLNMMESPSEVHIGKQMEKAVRAYLGVDAKMLGGIRYYEEVKRRMRMGEGMKSLWRISGLREDMGSIVKTLKGWMDRDG